MEASLFFSLTGFLLAAWAVVGNDSVQTLGTFLSSNKDVKWYWLFLATATVMIGTLLLGWMINDGDFSWGRLNKIDGPIEITFMFALAPLVLLFLTKIGLPVSTTFLILSVFATNQVMARMIFQSVAGYAIAMLFAFILWRVLYRVVDENKPILSYKHRRYWRIGQWFATMFLWSQWLMHDMANIAIYLPRRLSLPELVFALTSLTIFLGIIFRAHGGKIQNIVMEKTNTQFVRSATLIDLAFALTLLVFKQTFALPLSTTWVFVGLLAGRELSIHHPYDAVKHKTVIFPMLTRDFIKVLIGLAVSVVFALAVGWIQGLSR